jgi:hypothetical protein
MKVNTPSRVLLPILVALIIPTIPASAQMAPMGVGPMGPPGAGPSPWPSNQPPPCLAEFLKLRAVVEKLGMAAKAGHDHHASREEMCKLIGTFSGAEEKMVTYAAANVSGCGIPAEAVKQMRGNHEHTVMVRNQVCAAGPTPGPVAPTLSDALTNTSAPPTAKAAHTGTFDTLTGNPLKQ